MFRMTGRVFRAGSALFVAALIVSGVTPALAQQGGEPKPGDQKAAPADAGKDQKKIDEFAEASRVLGGPVRDPEWGWRRRGWPNIKFDTATSTTISPLGL